MTCKIIMNQRKWFFFRETFIVTFKDCKTLAEVRHQINTNFDKGLFISIGETAIISLKDIFKIIVVEENIIQKFIKYIKNSIVLLPDYFKSNQENTNEEKEIDGPW